MKPWTRENTQHWIAQLEHRVEDIDYYLNQTLQWCEDWGVYGEQQVFACSMMTVVWVSNMRHEPITKREALEILGVKDFYKAEDAVFELGEEFQNWDLEELLHSVVARF